MSAERAAYAAGLRALADIIDASPAVPLPYSGTNAELLIMFLDSGGDNRAGMAAAARAIGGPWAKQADSHNFELHGSLHGLRIALLADRGEVCTRVVTGTREVTKMIKDPAALAAVPEVEVTETVEDVEWDCGPLLAPVTR